VDKRSKQTVFVTGTGRCGTASISKVLAKAKNSIVLHEGVVEPPMDKEIFLVNPLFVEHLEAYLNPDDAEEILIKKRVPEINGIFEKFHTIDRFCEAAFYYVPFIEAIPRVFPKCRVAIIIRDGRHYVRSSTTTQVPDPKPVGYGPADEVTRKRYPYLFKGRLRPEKNSDMYKIWPTLTPFQKNSWVWAETNRMILDQISRVNQNLFKIFQFEELFFNKNGMEAFLQFVGFEDIDPMEVYDILSKKLNARKLQTTPHPDDWTAKMKNQFDLIAGEIMKKLGYY
jgi:hypothetical protein